MTLFIISIILICIAALALAEALANHFTKHFGDLDQ